MRKRLNLAGIGACCMAAFVIMAFASGCSESANSPEATVKMFFSSMLSHFEGSTSEEGYKFRKIFREGLDTLSIKKVEKNKDNDCAVVFFTLMKDGKDRYGTMVLKKIDDSPWLIGDNGDLETDDNFKEEMEKQISDWKKKNK